MNLPLILVSLVLLVYSSTANAFWQSGSFPKRVKNECEYFWSDEGRGFVVGRFNVLIDLKNADGDLEERAYIFIDCKGSDPRLPKHPFYDFKNRVSSCMGVRINSLDKPHLTGMNVFPIRPESIEVKSDSTDNKLVLVWEDASTFEIESEKSFSWTMKSKLTGATHQGAAECK